MFDYDWKMKTDYPQKNNGLKVFSMFACGGGSTMGYKLAGYDVLGCNEIDRKYMQIYKINHNPKYIYCEDIRIFNKRKDLPKELFNLDILDGSPPCSSFSMSGNREKDWKKKKKFAEGQEYQTLDDLVFEYINTINKLKPKVCILENVKGIMLGNAKWYSKKIFQKMSEKYNVQIFLLNASTMGVPQNRERIFFIGLRKDIVKNKLKLIFNQKPILFNEIENDEIENNKIIDCDLKYYNECKPGKSIATVHPKGNRFNSIKLHPFKVAPTIASGSCLYHYKYERQLNKSEIIKIGTFPNDFKFMNNNIIKVIGMSVPPVMMANISREIYFQWFK